MALFRTGEGGGTEKDLAYCTGLWPAATELGDRKSDLYRCQRKCCAVDVACYMAIG